MTRLTHREYKKLLECIRQLYYCTEAETFPSHALSVLSKIIAVDQITYDMIDIKTRQTVHAATPYSAPQKLLRLFERYMHEHPWISIFYPQDMLPHPFKNAFKSSGKRPPAPGTALLMSDALPDSMFRNLALYNEFYRHFDIEYQMVIPLMAGRNTLIGITFNRDKLDFSENERLILTTLGPHVVQAFGNAEAITKLKNRIENASGSRQSCRKRGPLPITGREGEVLHYVAMGKTNAEIAVILRIAPSTVKTHIERIYKKLGVENRMAASLLVR